LKLAIKELNNSIKFYENQRDEHLRFFNSDKFKDNITCKPDFVIESVNKIYDELIDELKQAINILKQSSCLECKGRGYIEYETGVIHDGYIEIMKEPCDCKGER
jgi:hypothetical protein